jgi:hypothetical protein
MNKLFASIACALLLCGTALAQPKIEIVGGSTLDWGTVKPPTSGHLEGTIQIKNVGNQLLKLTEIKPGCGCTKTDPDKTELKPGEISTMGVKLNISPAQSGMVHKSITVYSNSATDSVLTLWLKADIDRAVLIEPSPYFAFNGAVVGQPVSASVFIVNADKVDLVLSDFKVDPPMTLNVKDKDVIKPGDKLELVVSTTPVKAGPITGTITLRSSNADNPELTLSAYGNTAEATQLIKTAK